MDLCNLQNALRNLGIPRMRDDLWNGAHSIECTHIWCAFYRMCILAICRPDSGCLVGPCLRSARLTLDHKRTHSLYISCIGAVDHA